MSEVKVPPTTSSVEASRYAYLIEELVERPSKKEARERLKEVMRKIGIVALLDQKVEQEMNNLGKAIKLLSDE
jgi:hypothetical protein